MNRKPFRQSLSEGRGNCPLPSRTHPQKQNLVVYTEELTHLGHIDRASPDKGMTRQNIQCHASFVWLRDPFVIR
jgi:hypothetical protein